MNAQIAARARLRHLLEASEALRAAASAFHEALNDAPVTSAGLSVGLHEDDDEGETSVGQTLLHAEFLSDVVERLTGVVDDHANKLLAKAERALAAELTGGRS
jgi:hypothetical protein